MEGKTKDKKQERLNKHMHLLNLQLLVKYAQNKVHTTLLYIIHNSETGYIYLNTRSTKYVRV